MFLKDIRCGDIVEVMDMASLIDPCRSSITGRYHSGEEMQETEAFEKANLVFPSNEKLPECWVNPNYRAE